ncbi:MAG: ASKHA domain-containing protein, partial [Anaerolineae bacterium]|nr:ATP-binding protein [Thermoflexales bacterium]MDW8407207.1 ASKHA domain-containing protein [Anaerolineae bacterium]
QRIGLLNFPLEIIHPAGNTALLGAKMALFASDEHELYARIRSHMRHVSLNEDQRFMDTFVEEMSFPS